MSEVAQIPADAGDITDADITKSYIMNKVMPIVENGGRLAPVDLDVCTLVTPYEFVHLFGDAPMQDSNVATMFDNAEEDPESVGWRKLALYNGIHDQMVVSYTPQTHGPIALQNIYDTPERNTLLDLETHGLEELLKQIFRRIWLGEVGITWSRLVAKEALEGTDVQISTQDIAKIFSEYSRQADPREVCIFGYDVYRSNEPSTVAPIDIAIHVPVAAGQERETLPVLIDELARQTIHPSKAKTYFVHNRRKVEFSDDKDYIDADTEELEWMRSFYAEVASKYPHFQFEARYIIGEPSLTIGHIRRRSHLYAIDDYLRNSAENNPLMLNLDADTSQMNADFLQNVLTVADGSESPVIATRLGWKTADIKKQAPTVAKLLKLSSFLSSVAEADRGTSSFFDCGTAVRLREYCLSGGHIWHDEFYETGGIAHVIKQFPQHKGNLGSVVTASKSSRFKSDPRRQLYTMLQNSAPERAWDPDITTFGEHDDPVRKQSLDLQALEKQTVATLGTLIADMIEINIGWFFGSQTQDTQGRERYMRKQEVIAKGLELLGLPSMNELLS